jgi:preprotein translocase subunit YajC
MFKTLAFRSFAILGAMVALNAAADVVVTTNGARIVGKVTAIDAGTVVITTDYAGELKVKQALVASIETDTPVAVRLASGDRVTGVVTPTADGKEKIAGASVDAYTTIPQIAASWGAGQEDPAVTALRRKWAYEADVDINGENGTHNQLGTNLGFKATLKGPDDNLGFYSAYNRQATNGLKSADQFKAGVDYTDNLSAQTSWYVRDEGGFDRVMLITFDDIAAAGFGYNFVKTADQTLTGRIGVSYRAYQYAAGDGTPNISAIGGDAEIQYEKSFGTSKLTDKITYVPDLQDTKSYVITHEFGYAIPLAASEWKLTTGVSNNYDSEPAPGVKRLETLYFTRLSLTWGQK